MNTPAHVALNLALVPHRRWAACVTAVILGALAPDAMMFVFYGYQKSVMGLAEERIWSEAYFEQGWQDLFDVFNSMPLILALGLLGIVLRSVFIEALAASMLLHVLLDFPLHNDDAHRHFYPLSDWRFESPVSYWDSRFYGDVFMFVELMLVSVAVVYVVRSEKERWVKVVSLVTGAVYAAFIVFALIHWGGLL